MVTLLLSFHENTVSIIPLRGNQLRKSTWKFASAKFHPHRKIPPSGNWPLVPHSTTMSFNIFFYFVVFNMILPGWSSMNGNNRVIIIRRRR